MSSPATALFRYVGPGGEIFPDFHWQPEPGDERELPADTATPSLERVDSKSSARKPATDSKETA